MNELRVTKVVVGLLSALLAGCGPVMAIAGNGKVVDDARTVGAFRAVSINSAFDATVTTGARSVTITADQNLLPELETVLEGDTLVVRVRAGVQLLGGPTLKVAIVNDVLEGVAASGAARVVATATPISTFPVSASGASEVTVTGLSGDRFTVGASGASSVTLSGRATSATVTASGGSDLHLRGVPLSQLELDASGASTIDAAVSTTLSGSASGASTVHIAGTPANQVAVSGASVVTLGNP